MSLSRVYELPMYVFMTKVTVTSSITIRLRQELLRYSHLAKGTFDFYKLTKQIIIYVKTFDFTFYFRINMNIKWEKSDAQGDTSMT